MAGSSKAAPADLSPLLNPRSVAVIGASTSPTSVGGRTAAHLTRSSYAGRTYLVNPRYDTINGLKCFEGIESVPEAVDLAIVATSAPSVVDIVARGLASGVRAFVVFASGFSDAGSEAGRSDQSRLAALVNSHGALLCGPNCAGFVNLHLGLSASFATPLAHVGLSPGHVAVVSQSGALGFYLTAMAAECNIGLSHVITTGNEAQLSVGHFLAALASDDHTDTVIVYLESLGGLDVFLDGVRLLTDAGRRVIVCKPGKSAAGAAMTRSHTAAVTGPQAVFEAVSRRFGAIIVSDIDTALDVARVTAGTGLRKASTLGVVSLSGGAAAIAADLVAETELTLARYPVETANDDWPEFLRLQNPLDLTGHIVNQPEALEAVALELGSASQDVLMWYLGHVSLDPPLVSTLLRAVRSASPDASAQPAVISAIPTPMVESAVQAMREEGAPVAFLPTLRSAVLALAAFAGAPPLAAEPWPGTVAARASGPSGEGHGVVRGSASAYKVLADWGVPGPPFVRSAQVGALLDGVHRIGFPAVLKVDPEGIRHRSDRGGVILSISDIDELVAAVETLKSRWSPETPLLLMPMLPKGTEILVSVRHDDVVGPYVTVGSGGRLVETLRDVVVLPLPIDREYVEWGLNRLKLWSPGELERVAGGQAIEALIDFVIQVAAGFAADPDTIELEMNPVLLHPGSRIVSIADAKVETRSSTS